MACNTASASALRKLQQEWLPHHYPNRRVLGVVVPTIEYAIEKGYEKLGLLGTNYTVSSKIYLQELTKINPNIRLHQVNTPLFLALLFLMGVGPLISWRRASSRALAKIFFRPLIAGCGITGLFLFLESLLASLH